VAELVGALPASGIPHHLRDGLVRYFSDGILPGSFLQSVLCNDLREAIVHANQGTEHALRPLIEYLAHHVPDQAWGSRDKVLAWTTTPNRLEI
jgi:hypothetical protein